MSVKRLNHVAIVVNDLRETHEFYSGLLGLERIERPPEVKAGGPGAWYAIGDRQLHVFIRPGVTEASDRHVALEIDDMDALVERLKKAGFMVEDSFSFGEFKRRKFTRDPSGHLIEMMSRE
jgi:catechol 2,3-dioxygenase-like lactoylglutathione lyase family enzyme